MDATREIIAENIAALRRDAKLTQAELAEKLNYSDKAISKWERGDSIPDVLVLAELAELFSVTVDYFLKKHEVSEKKPKLEADKKRMRLAITVTSCISPYFIVTLLFFIFREVFSKPDWLWKLFIVALPVVAIIALVFSAIWSKKKTLIFAFVSMLLWTLLLSAFVFLNEIIDAWLLFVVGAPLQIIIWLWLVVLRKRK